MIATVSKYISILLNVKQLERYINVNKNLLEEYNERSMVKRQLPIKRSLVLIVSAGVVILLIAVLSLKSKPSVFENKPSEESFLAPGRDWSSPKKVEDYFISNLHMTPEEAKAIRSSEREVDGKITLRLTQNTTLEGLVSNLEYYGFVRDKNALLYALEHSTDNVLGKQGHLIVGTNSIDTWSSYRISEDMSAWQVADQLLNHPTYFSFDQYGYMFMP